MNEAILEWTGHPLVDVGIATLCAMSEKTDPADLTLKDLDTAAAEMEEYYFSGLLMSYLTCVFMNSEYVQAAAGPKKDQRQRAYIDRVLNAHRSKPDEGVAGKFCAFSGQPATHLVHRGQMPLLTGEGVLNFFPAGTGALPVAGPYLTALQALPMGGRRTEGRLLVAHSDSPELTADLARLYLQDNRRLLALAKAGRLPDKDGPDSALVREQGAWDAAKKRAKYPDAKSAQSLITADLMKVWEEKSLSSLESPYSSLTIYWLSSSGQGPSLSIFHLPSNLIKFLRIAGTAETRPEWNRLVNRGWAPLVQADATQEPVGTKKGRQKRKPAGSFTGGPGLSRNRVLCDLFPIYENGFVDLAAAQRFLRRHILSEIDGRIQSGDEVRWDLAELFLKEVLGMEPSRIQGIRDFSDRLAEHVKLRNDRDLFRGVVYGRASWEMRNALTKAQRDEAKENNRLLFGLEEYLNVFEADDSVGNVDWRLIRDLISIRLVEQLQKSGYLDKNKDLLAKEVAAEEVAAEK